MCIGTAGTCRPNPSRSPTGSAALPMAAPVVAGRPVGTNAVAGLTGARPEWYWVIGTVRQQSVVYVNHAANSNWLQTRYDQPIDHLVGDSVAIGANSIAFSVMLSRPLHDPGEALNRGGKRLRNHRIVDDEIAPIPDKQSATDEFKESLP
jgi:hypothetical protein